MFELTGGSVVDAHGDVIDARGVGSATPTLERGGLLVAFLLALCGGAAIVVTRRAGRRRAGDAFVPTGPVFLWLIPLSTLFVTAVLNGLPRDRLPADPFLLLLAGIGAAWLYDRVRERARPQA
jgi:hypothetical protein